MVSRSKPTIVIYFTPVSKARSAVSRQSSLNCSAFKCICVSNNIVILLELLVLLMAKRSTHHWDRCDLKQIFLSERPNHSAGLFLPLLIRDSLIHLPLRESYLLTSRHVV